MIAAVSYYGHMHEKDKILAKILDHLPAGEQQFFLETLARHPEFMQSMIDSAIAKARAVSAKDLTRYRAIMRAEQEQVERLIH